MTDDRKWWSAALAGDAPAITGDPQAGFYKRRLVKGGPWVPVHIWIERELDDAGDMLSDERIMCSVDGRIVPVDDHWTYACAKPIPETEFDYLTRLSGYAKARDPREPLSKPRRKIDPLSFPLPDLKPSKKRKA